MIVREIYGDLFEVASAHDCYAVGHGCNTYGVMGAGIAKLFKEKFPSNYEYYKQLCDKARKQNVEITGSYLAMVNPHTGKTIYNLFTQDKPGPYAKLEWIKESLTEVCVDNEFAPAKLCIPKIGCGIGGLEWKDVKEVIESIDSNTQVVVAYI